MLTSHHYLLSGLLAVACATGVMMRASLGIASDLSSDLSQTAESVSLDDAIDVSYRGSGRIDDTPDKHKKNTERYREKFLISHRGSGRVSPSLL